MKFVEHSLDEHLVPIKQVKPEKRYFVREGKDLQFFESLTEAQRIYGSGKGSPVKDYLFCPGSILDNPIGLAQNEGYIATLKAPSSRVQKTATRCLGARTESRLL